MLCTILSKELKTHQQWKYVRLFESIFFYANKYFTEQSRILE